MEGEGREGRQGGGRLLYRVLSPWLEAAEGRDIALHMCHPVFFPEACGLGVA